MIFISIDFLIYIIVYVYWTYYDVCRHRDTLIIRFKVFVSLLYYFEKILKDRGVEYYVIETWKNIINGY